MTGLKPCPWCGGKAKINTLRGCAPYVECQRCGVRVSFDLADMDTCTAGSEEKAAASSWNRRTGTTTFVLGEGNGTFIENVGTLTIHAG